MPGKRDAGDSGKGGGWDAGIRTPIRRSRVCSLTVRRRPNATPDFSKPRPAESSSRPRSTLELQHEEVLAARPAARGASAGGAVDWKTLRPEGYVSDFAHVIDPADQGPVEAYCVAVEQSTGAQMALVTMPSLEGEPIEDVANTIFRAWGVGRKGQNEGIMMLLAVGDRRSRLEVGNGLEPILPDGLAGGILREMRPALRAAGLRRSHDGRGADHRRDHRARQERDARRPPCPRTMRPTVSNSIPWPLILGGILLLFWLLRAGRSPRLWRGAAADFSPG